MKWLSFISVFLSDRMKHKDPDGSTDGVDKYPGMAR